MKIAIVTGASSGLGVEFTKTIANKVKKLDEIWVIARRKERLEQLTEQFLDVKIRPIPLDVGNDNSYEEFAQLLKEERPDIKILINNAGYEKSGRFMKMEMKDILSMINVNIKGMTAINRICLPYMKEGSFAIITCSVSSFTPVPNQTVYSASKRYVYFVGKALREEMLDVGVNVLLLCPGNMDTDMNPKGQMRQSRQINSLPFLDMKKLTEKSLIKAKQGKAVYTPGTFYKFYRVTSKLFPSAFMMKIAKGFY